MDGVARGGEIAAQKIRRIEGKDLIGAGGTIKVLLESPYLLTLEANYPAGVRTPPHAHDHDSHCYVLKGRLQAMLEGETTELHPGDAMVQPAGATHSLEALEDSTWIEAKSPPSVVWE